MLLLRKMVKLNKYADKNCQYGVIVNVYKPNFFLLFSNLIVENCYSCNSNKIK